MLIMGKVKEPKVISKNNNKNSESEHGNITVILCSARKVYNVQTTLVSI